MTFKFDTTEILGSKIVCQMDPLSSYHQLSEVLESLDSHPLQYHFALN